MKQKVFLILLLFCSFSLVAMTVGHSAGLHAVTTQTDGKIVAVGRAEECSKYKLLVARYENDGALDTSFSDSGVSISQTGTNSQAYAVAISQTDGKIIVGGEADACFLLQRYNTDGSLDTGFGTSGEVMQSIGSAAVIHDIVIQPDEKILAGGLTVIDGAFCGLIYRYNADGTVDANFGTNGVVMTMLKFGSVVYGIKLQSDGKIVAVGYAECSKRLVAILRYNSDGTLDTNFGTDGFTTKDVGQTAELNGLQIQDDGKIVAAGSSDGQALVVRYNTDGTFDSSFGVNGITTTEIGDDAQFQDVAVESDGKIICVGFNKSFFVAARYSAAGVQDSIFKEGIIGRAYGINLQANGNILLVGDSDYNCALFVYGTSGVKDTSFGTNGAVLNPSGTKTSSGAMTFIWEEQSVGTNAGTFTQELWQTRSLNKIAGSIGAVVLSNDEFTLQAGSYLIHVSAPAYRVDTNRIRLCNVTNNTVEKYGTSVAASNEGFVQVQSSLDHHLVVSQPTTFKIEHYCETTQTNDGLGVAAGIGGPEIYSRVRITRIEFFQG